MANDLKDETARMSQSPANGDRQPQPVIGARIRELRRAKRLTLQGLAAASGLSIGYISQLERNLATPSIRALSAVARALDANVSWFLPDPERDEEPGSDVVVRARTRRSLRFESGVRDELLSPSLSGQLEMMRCTFEPEASSGDEPYAHEGEEAGYVAEGQLELTLEDTVYWLEAGDSFHFESERPHRYRNPGPGTTVVIWAMTPPRY